MIAPLEFKDRLRHSSEFLRGLGTVSGPGPIANTVRQSIADAIDEALALIEWDEDRIHEIGKRLTEVTEERDGYVSFASDITEKLQAICDKYGALGGDNRVEFIAEKLATLTTRAEAAEAQLSRLQSDCDEMRKALEPFAADKLPSSKQTVRDFDEHGLRRMMSPMEIARLRARKALSQPTGRG